MKHQGLKQGIFQITLNEARDDKDVVSGTLLINSSPVDVLIDLSTSTSFVNKSFYDRLNATLTPWERP